MSPQNVDWATSPRNAFAWPPFGHVPQNSCPHKYLALPPLNKKKKKNTHTSLPILSLGLSRGDDEREDGAPMLALLSVA
jgi:hypothetical protein